MRLRCWELGVAAIAVVIVVVTVRDGLGQVLDAAVYRSAVDNLSSGRGVTTNISPSFSRFDAATFVDRGGSIPFVDFALGFPLLAAIPALLFGVSGGIIAVQAGSAAAVGWVLAARPAGGRNSGAVARALVAIGVVMWTPWIITVRGGLSEPLFCALAVGSAFCAVRGHQSERAMTASVLLAGAAGFVRFVGAPLVLVPAVLAIRHRGVRKGVSLTAVACLPALVNILWGSEAAPTSRLGLRKLNVDDLRFATTSIGGWLSRPLSSIDRVVASPAWPPLWSWLAAGAWVLAAVLASRSLFAAQRARRWVLPPEASIPLVMAATLVVALLSGMIAFDSLVTADQRLMLPVGALTAAAAAWNAHRVRMSVGAGVAVLWLAASAAPSAIVNAPADYRIADLDDAIADSPVVVSNAADPLWWQSGVPAAYLPQPTDLLSGEPNDVDEDYESLLCALADADGSIIIVPAAFAPVPLELEALVAEGRLEQKSFGVVVRYSPTASACR